MPIDFQTAPLWMNLAVFSGAGAAVWFAGSRLAHYVDGIAERTGMGHALAGLLVLGVITSLPEAAVTVAAGRAGHVALAVNNLLGGVAFGFAILAIADISIGREALTSVVPDPVVILQGALSILLLAMVTLGILVGDRALFGIGAWCWGILALYLLAAWMTQQLQGRYPWHPNQEHGPTPPPPEQDAERERTVRRRRRGAGHRRDHLVHRRFGGAPRPDRATHGL